MNILKLVFSFDNNPLRRPTKCRAINLAGVLAFAFCLIWPNLTIADADEDLAKQLSNPISALVSVPLQLNYDEGYGSEDGEQLRLNIQPVIPFSLNEDLNLISRTIVPVIYQNDIFGASGDQFGLGDTTASFWLSPKAPTSFGLIWGVGPIFYLPTATDELLGIREWGGGPTVVGLMQKGPWTIGGLANHVWSVDGDEINSTFVQPFANYTTADAWTFTLNTESTYNWNTEEWAIPINATVSKLVAIGGQRVQFSIGARYWLETAAGGPDDLGARFTTTLLFPK